MEGTKSDRNKGRIEKRKGLIEERKEKQEKWMDG